MERVFDERVLAHAPARELHNGGWAPFAEVPRRATGILAATGGPARPAVDHGCAPLEAVHDPAYLDFLEGAHGRWLAAGREGDALPYAWPVVARRRVPLDRIDALLGRYSFDATSPITAETWAAVYWSAQAALTALDPLLAGGERTSFALCRPPGHHAGADYLGGYCYINSAAVAAQAATAAGQRVAILDVDYHHGNGTQDIFYGRGDVFFASVHADPRTDYPFFWGHADERGEGAGEGATLNLPLPRGTGWREYRPALAKALEAIARFGPSLLVVSFGADTYAGDPICGFGIGTADYPAMARDIAALDLPTLLVMEGGYAVDALGDNVAAFLSGW